MQITALLLTAALSALPAAQQEASSTPPAIDFEAAIEEAVAELVAEDAARLELQERDPVTGRFVQADTGTGYFGMLADGMTHGGELAFVAASALEIWSSYELRQQCEANPYVSCTDPFPGTVQQDALMTAATYAGVKGLQRLAKTQWDVDLDDGWKDLAIFGAMTLVRSLVTAQNVSDANALRDLR